MQASNEANGGAKQAFEAQFENNDRTESEREEFYKVAGQIFEDSKSTNYFDPPAFAPLALRVLKLWTIAWRSPSTHRSQIALVVSELIALSHGLQRSLGFSEGNPEAWADAAIGYCLKLAWMEETSGVVSLSPAGEAKLKELTPTDGGKDRESQRQRLLNTTINRNTNQTAADLRAAIERIPKDQGASYLVGAIHKRFPKYLKQPADGVIAAFKEYLPVGSPDEVCKQILERVKAIINANAKHQLEMHARIMLASDGHDWDSASESADKAHIQRTVDSVMTDAAYEIDKLRYELERPLMPPATDTRKPQGAAEIANWQCESYFRNELSSDALVELATLVEMLWSCNLSNGQEALRIFLKFCDFESRVPARRRGFNTVCQLFEIARLYCPNEKYSDVCFWAALDDALLSGLLRLYDEHKNPLTASASKLDKLSARVHLSQSGRTAISSAPTAPQQQVGGKMTAVNQPRTLALHLDLLPREYDEKSVRFLILDACMYKNFEELSRSVSDRMRTHRSPELIQKIRTELESLRRHGDIDLRSDSKYQRTVSGHSSHDEMRRVLEEAELNKHANPKDFFVRFGMTATEAGEIQIQEVHSLLERARNANWPNDPSNLAELLFSVCRLFGKAYFKRDVMLQKTQLALIAVKPDLTKAFREHGVQLLIAPEIFTGIVPGSDGWSPLFKAFEDCVSDGRIRTNDGLEYTIGTSKLVEVAPRPPQIVPDNNTDSIASFIKCVDEHIFNVEHNNLTRKQHNELQIQDFRLFHDLEWKFIQSRAAAIAKGRKLRNKTVREIVVLLELPGDNFLALKQKWLEAKVSLELDAETNARTSVIIAAQSALPVV